MQNNNFNNGAANNNSNNNGGMMIMMNGTIRTMEVFAGTVKSAMEAVYGSECKVDVHKVVKNNGLHLTGITIRNRESNMAPTIYLDGYFADYKDGRTMENICKEIVEVYEKNKVQKDFSLEKVTDFDNVKDRICFKLVNREKNAELLEDAPYVEYQDLAVIFYILVSKDNTGTASITVRTTLKEMWGVDTDTLYDLAKKNTQRLFRGRVLSMMEVMAEIIGDSADALDEEMVEAFFDMDVYEDSAFPMYVATNVFKMNGACILLYDGVLEKFAEKIGGDFYILPSSVHEVLFVPANGDMDARYLIEMVREVNATQVAPDEVLSDNVYMYHADKDFVEMM